MTTDSAPMPSRWSVLVPMARSWATAAAAKIDSFDVACFVSLSMMLFGLTLWFGLGPALTVVGALLFGLVVYGARTAEVQAAADKTRGGQDS